MTFGEYIPSPEEMELAESSLTLEQGVATRERERSLLNPEKVNYFEKNGSVSLNLNRADIPLDKIEDLLKLGEFTEKEEFHVTILSTKNWLIIKKLLENNPDKQGIASKIRSLIEETDWRFALEPKWYRVSKEYPILGKVPAGESKVEKRESCIQMVKVLGIKTFYDKLNKIINTEDISLEPPPTHITLCTKGKTQDSSLGIGIYSWSEFNQLNPEAI